MDTITPSVNTVVTGPTKKRVIVSRRAPGSVQKLVVQRPSTQKPAVQKPSIQRSSTQKPVVQRPVVQKPVVQRLSIQKPKPAKSGSGCNSCAARRMARQAAEAAQKAPK